ncbi:MAG: hypothetical protein NXI31_15085 [bacterium]|nr:hypothetical protein [bacterium]
MQSNRSLSVLAMLAAATLTSCAASGTNVGIVVDPKETAIYINGEKAGTGKRVYTFDFSKHPRALLQATAYGCKPHYEVWTKRRLLEHIKEFKQLEIILKQERF